MSLAAVARKILHRRSALLQANVGVLGQKLDLLAALRNTMGPNQANERFAETCPIVGASVGQHFRHSMDHMERVANSIEAEKEDGSDGFELHYDTRVRGGNDENDMDAAEDRIQKVSTIFQNEIDIVVSLSHGNNVVDAKRIVENSNHSVRACFLLSGDSQDEFSLSSTIERELGFVAHHAIHHLAMVKIISMHTLELLPPGGLPEGFGMAPSTIVYDKNSQ